MRTFLLALLLVPALAGCLTDDGAEETQSVDVAPVPDPTHVLAGAVEPDGLVAPAFDLLGSIAAGGPVYGAGEPSVWAGLDGVLHVAFPGCDRGFALAPLPTDDGTCGHGLVYRSDDGATWTRLNREGDGRYTDDGPPANGDADVAVDSAGTVYASNLGGGGIQLHAYDPATDAWSYLGNVVPPTEDPNDPAERREGADRQWLAAAGPGHVINAWMRTSPERDVAINTTFDGGATWTGTTYFGDGIGWLGTVQFAPDGQHAYIPYTQPLSNPAAALYGSIECAVRVIATTDGGRTWDDVDTGARITTTETGGHWSCVHMAPALDVTGDGTVVVAWSQDVSVPTGAGAPDHAYPTAGQSLRVVLGREHGTNWTETIPIRNPTEYPGVTTGSGAIMPWVTGGAGDRFALTWLQTDTPADQDYAAATWDVRAGVFDGLGTDDAQAVVTTIEAEVHVGGICTRGGTCLLTGSDRAFLDFFESDVLPDGRLVVVYPHDLNESKTIDIKVAIQDGGTPLLALAA